MKLKNFIEETTGMININLSYDKNLIRPFFCECRTHRVEISIASREVYIYELKGSELPVSEFKY